MDQSELEVNVDDPLLDSAIGSSADVRESLRLKMTSRCDVTSLVRISGVA